MERFVKREFKGRGAGEGLAVVNGHQCGVEGGAVEINRECLFAIFRFMICD